MSKRTKPFWAPTTPTKLAPHIMVCVFTGVERTGWVNSGLTTTLMRMAHDSRVRMSYVAVHAVYPVSAARNFAVENFFLKTDCEMLVMLDNDVQPPPDLMDAIVSMPEQADIGVLPYW